MKSPFPGMDPFIEGCNLWGDFHDHLIEEIYRSLTETVPQRYVVRTGERSYVVLENVDEGKPCRLKTDVSVVGSPLHQASFSSAPVVSLAELPATNGEPVPMLALIETEFRETFIEIRELEPLRRLVTCIEVLSPSNKRFESPGWHQYCRKRQAFLQGGANLIEIDLLRGGQRMPMATDWPASPYALLVARKEKAPHCLVWPGHFMRSLPPIQVPLASPDPDVPLVIQPMIDAIYARSRYDHDINYRGSINPPLSDTETAWLGQRLPDQENPA